MINCVERLSSQENKDNLSEISQRLNTVIRAIHLPCRRRFGHCHFLKSPQIYVIFKASVTTQERLCQATIWMRPMIKHQRSLMNVFCPSVIHLLHRFLPSKPETKRTSTTRAYIEYIVTEGTTALICTLRSSQVKWPRLYFSYWSCHESHVFQKLAT